MSAGYWLRLCALAGVFAGSSERLAGSVSERAAQAVAVDS